MKIKTRDMILVAMFAALTAIGAFIKIPTQPIPVSLQVFFVAMSGIILGSRLGALSQIVYVATGLIGIPIFTNGGGPSYIFQPSFGYLIGFILGAFIIGKLTEKMKTTNIFKLYGATVVGIISIYIVALPYLYMIMNLYLGKGKDLAWVLKNGCYLFLPKDLIMGVIMVIISSEVLKRLRSAGYVK